MRACPRKGSDLPSKPSLPGVPAMPGMPARPPVPPRPPGPVTPAAMPRVSQRAWRKIVQQLQQARWPKMPNTKATDLLGLARRLRRLCQLGRVLLSLSQCLPAAGASLPWTSSPSCEGSLQAEELFKLPKRATCWRVRVKNERRLGRPTVRRGAPVRQTACIGIAATGSFLRSRSDIIGRGVVGGERAGGDPIRRPTGLTD